MIVTERIGPFWWIIFDPFFWSLIGIMMFLLFLMWLLEDKKKSK